MTFKERLDRFGVKLINTNMKFVEQKEKELEDLLFVNGITECLFKISVSNGFKEIQIAERKELTSSASGNFRFLFMYNGWLLISDKSDNQLLLFKIE